MPLLHELNIVVVKHLEDREVGHWITPLRTHWFVSWVRRLFGKSDFVGWIAHEMPRKPEFLRLNDKILTSPLGFETLKKEFARNAEGLLK